MALQKSFWRLFTPAQAPGTRKFTLDELRELYGVLMRNPVVTEANRALVVETIREVAEYMIWGDQNEPRIFDFFLENNVMTYLHRMLLQPANRKGDVARQVLQTLGIIIQNVRSQTAIFVLFSNNHVNNIVDLDFDFEDEEVLGYYISFLKTISLKLNKGTVQFFFDTSGTSTVAFPLYTRAVTLALHREGMVRAAVRTLTLNVYSVDDAHIQSFVTSPPASGYFTDVAGYLAEQVQLLDRRMVAAEGGSVQALNSLDSQLAEVEDILSYCSDTLSLGVPCIAHLMAESLWKAVIGPVLLKSLMEGVPAQDGAAGLSSAVAAALGHGSPSHGSPAAGQGHLRRGSWSNSPSSKLLLTGTPDGSGSPLRPTTPSTPARVRPVCAVFVLERLFQLIMYGPLVHQTLLALLAGNPNSSNSSGKEVAEATAAAAAAATAAVQRGPGQVDNTDATASTSEADGSRSSSRQRQSPQERNGHQPAAPSCRHALLEMLAGEQAYSAVIALRLLVAILLNRHLSAALLSALGILPRRRQQQQQQQSSGSSGGSSGEAYSDAEARVLLQVCLQQLQQRQEPGGGTTSSSSGERADGSSGLAAMLTGAYLAAQLQELVSGVPKPDAQAAARSSSPIPAAAGPATDLSLGVTAAQSTGAAPAADTRQTLPSTLEAAASSIDSEGVEAIAAVFGGVREQLVEALFALLQAQALPAAGLWWLGWLLHQLLPVATPEAAGVAGLGEAGAALTAAQQEQLQSVLEGAQEALLGELSGMWCEAVFAIMSLEWQGAREGLLRPVLRASSEGLLSGAHVHSVLLEQQQRQRAAAAPAQNGVGASGQPSPRGGGGGGGAGGGLEAALSSSARSALGAYRAVQRVVALRQLHELLTIGVVSKSPPVPMVSEAELKQVDIQEGYTVDLAPGSAIPCVVSFAPGQERRVFYAVAGLSLRNRSAPASPEPGSAAARTQASALLRSLPVAVLADPVAGKTNQGVVLSVAPLLGADPSVDKNVPKWLHVHVRPSVRGLLRVLKTAVVKKGGLLTSMRQLADGHWVLAFPDADRAAAARSLTHKHTSRLRALYSEALGPLLSGQAQAALVAGSEVSEADGSETGLASSLGGAESEGRQSMEQQRQQQRQQHQEEQQEEDMLQQEQQEEFQEGQELQEIRRPQLPEQQEQWRQQQQQQQQQDSASMGAETAPAQQPQQGTPAQAPATQETAAQEELQELQAVPQPQPQQLQAQQLPFGSEQQQQPTAEARRAQQQQQQQQQQQEWQQQDEGGWSGSDAGDDPLAGMSELSLYSGASAGSSLIAAAAGGALTLDAMASTEGSWPSEVQATQPAGAAAHEHHSGLT